MTVFLLVAIGGYGVFSSEKVDATKTRRFLRREFNHLPTGDFAVESSEIALTGARHGIHGHFVVDEVKGDLKRVPAVRWSALWNGEIPMPEWAGREVRAIELALEVNRRHVQRVLRVLAHRMIVRSDGLHDVDRELHRAMEVMSAAHDPVDPIRALELAANRFWVPIEADLIRLAGATDLPVREIKAALVP